MDPSCAPEVRHGGQCHQTMFTKQVSRRVGGLDPIAAAEAEQVERTRRKTWSRARSEVFVPYTPLVFESPGPTDSYRHHSSPMRQDVGVHDVGRCPGSIGVDLVEYVGELQVELVLRHVPDVGRDNDVLHLQQRM